MPSSVLDEDHYGLKDVKDRVLEFLAVRQLRARELEQQVQEDGEVPTDALKEEKDTVTPDASPRASPGTGRSPTSRRPRPARWPRGRSSSSSDRRAWARPRSQRASPAPWGGNMSAPRSAACATRPTSGAIAAPTSAPCPGRIIQGLKQAGTKNPVFLLDEVDKLGVSFQGDPASALLEVLDPAQNDSFTDHYLNVPFDLSEVLFIATANYLQNIPAPLLDRMEVVDFSGYTEREKAEIARTYLIPRQVEESGLKGRGIAFTDEAVMSIVSRYTRESGVRQLERQVGAVARKVARKLAAGEEVPATITPEDVRDLLGRPRVHPERVGQADEVGVATGMYYTPAGGDIMFVEAAVRRLPGGGEVRRRPTRRRSRRAGATWA